MPPTSPRPPITCRPESASAVAVRRGTCRASRWSIPVRPAVERPERKGGARGVKPLVLIVEDQEALVTMLRYNLEGYGFRVNAAGDGEEALVAAAEEVPDLILLDWMLPLASGIEVCHQLRSKPDTRRVPRSEEHTSELQSLMRS